MVIDPNNSLNSHGTSAGKARQAATGKVAKSADKPSPAATNRGEGDNVSLSAVGQAIAKIEARMATVSEVDQAKVEELRAAISSGNYQIDSQSIAAKILAEENLLG